MNDCSRKETHAYLHYGGTIMKIILKTLIGHWIGFRSISDRPRCGADDLFYNSIGALNVSSTMVSDLIPLYCSMVSKRSLV